MYWYDWFWMAKDGEVSALTFDVCVAFIDLNFDVFGRAWFSLSQSLCPNFVDSSNPTLQVEFLRYLKGTVHSECKVSTLSQKNSCWTGKNFNRLMENQVHAANHRILVVC